MSSSENFGQTLENVSPMHYFSPDQRDADSVVTWLVRAVAEVEGCSPKEVDFTISDVVDPDALDRLFDSAGNMHAQLMFHINGHEIRLGSDGSLLVVEAPN